MLHLALSEYKKLLSKPEPGLKDDTSNNKQEQDNHSYNNTMHLHDSHLDHCVDYLRQVSKLSFHEK